MHKVFERTIELSFLYVIKNVYGEKNTVKHISDPMRFMCACIGIYLCRV